jgi:hypothetical protein
MKLFNIVIIFFTFSFTSLFAASNDNPILYDEVGGWEIGILPHLNFGCYTSSPVYEGGSMLSIYKDNRSGMEEVYLHLVNPSWSSLKIGELYKMKVIFEPFSDGWIGDAEVVSYGDHKGIEFNTNVDFLVAFAEMESIRFLYKDREILNLELKGSYKAALSLSECQSMVNDSGITENVRMERGLDEPSSRDPFLD